jgi:hypothetical protein
MWPKTWPASRAGRDSRTAHQVEHQAAEDGAADVEAGDEQDDPAQTAERLGRRGIEARRGVPAVAERLLAAGGQQFAQTRVRCAARCARRCKRGEVAVHRLAGQVGNENLHVGAADDEQSHQQERPAIAAEVLPQPPQRGPGAAWLARLGGKSLRMIHHNVLSEQGSGSRGQGRTLFPGPWNLKPRPSRPPPTASDRYQRRRGFLPSTPRVCRGRRRCPCRGRESGRR